MYLLRGISPRLLSILCSNDIGKVIPNFSVLSGFFLILLTILVDCIYQFYTISVYPNLSNHITPTIDFDCIGLFDNNKKYTRTSMETI